MINIYGRAFFTAITVSLLNSHYLVLAEDNTQLIKPVNPEAKASYIESKTNNIVNTDLGITENTIGETVVIKAEPEHLSIPEINLLLLTKYKKLNNENFKSLVNAINQNPDTSSRTKLELETEIDKLYASIIAERKEILIKFLNMELKSLKLLPIAEFEEFNKTFDDGIFATPDYFNSSIEYQNWLKLQVKNPEQKNEFVSNLKSEYKKFTDSNLFVLKNLIREQGLLPKNLMPLEKNIINHIAYDLRYSDKLIPAPIKVGDRLSKVFIEDWAEEKAPNDNPDGKANLQYMVDYYRDIELKNLLNVIINEELDQYKFIYKSNAENITRQAFNLLMKEKALSGWKTPPSSLDDLKQQIKNLNLEDGKTFQSLLDENIKACQDDLVQKAQATFASLAQQSGNDDLRRFIDDKEYSSGDSFSRLILHHFYINLAKTNNSHILDGTDYKKLFIVDSRDIYKQSEKVDWQVLIEPYSLKDAIVFYKVASSVIPDCACAPDDTIEAQNSKKIQAMQKAYEFLFYQNIPKQSTIRWHVNKLRSKLNSGRPARHSSLLAEQNSKVYRDNSDNIHLVLKEVTRPTCEKQRIDEFAAYAGKASRAFAESLGIVVKAAASGMTGSGAVVTLGNFTKDATGIAKYIQPKITFTKNPAADEANQDEKTKVTAD
jgi:hypothetical protein